MEHNSRLRKYYRLTQKGRQRIREFLVEWEDVMKAYRYIAASQEEGTMEETEKGRACMRKQEFLNQLAAALAGMDREERYRTPELL